MNNSRIEALWCSFFLIGTFAALSYVAAQQRTPPPPPTPGPMLSDGTMTLQTPELELSLVRSSQTVAALHPTEDKSFDFTPGDLLVERSRDGYYHLGDIDLRLREGSSGEWKSYSTALARTPVNALPGSGSVLAAADLSPTLPADIPLEITRSWQVEDGKLVLRFVLKNKMSQPVQIGSLGIPMVFDNVLNNRTLEQAHAICSFYDPYVGMDAGYLQVTRLNGHGPALLVVPDGKTAFEAYSPILGLHRTRGSSGPPAPQIFTDPTPRGMTFEGFYDWMVHTTAFAENEWKNAQQWNPPTELTLAPGESKTYGLKFLVSDSIRDIESTLAANRRPVAVGVPGYVVPTDLDVRLFINYAQPIRSISVEPAGALTWQKDVPTKDGWKAFTLMGHTWGRARLVVTYEDGLAQAIHYDVIKPEREAVADLGRFLTTKQWFVDPNDPFHRGPSAISYDREANQMVKQDSRVWIAGLSDEAGAGSWLALLMKEFGQPDKQELDKVQQFVDGVLWGHLQYSDGEKQYGVRKSLFYYQPDELPPNYYRDDLNWHNWTSWSKKASEQVDRSFDYPHVAAAYWVMYRLARDHQGLVTNHDWRWYLSHAYETSMAMTKFAGGYARFGQMEGDIFVKILDDLRREGMTAEAQGLEAKMRERADRWKQEPYPFGSEMPWDSTGQEEVDAWTKFFGFEEKAEVTLDAILGYMPTVPHWGYNGSARRFWDFLYAGKYPRLERQLHHYGSGLNAIPVLAAYREHPDDFYLLRVGYGGTMGSLTNIDQDGFASCAFHAFPDMLKFDPYSGDYGPNFFGHALNTATYIVDHPDFGWVAFGANITAHNGIVKAKPLDSFRNRIYLAPVGLWLTLDSGGFSDVEFDSRTNKVRVGLAPRSEGTAKALLRIEQPAKPNSAKAYELTKSLPTERGAYAVPLGAAVTWVELREK
ncbi:MAG TPA: DUF5695 domain-containing protein [Terriglobales bacterium]|nr:DUF5695 domain-containing protein [Terriglobales bacterium]